VQYLPCEKQYSIKEILIGKNEKKLARSFDFTFRYIDNAFSLNISKFDDIFDPTDTTSSVS
jgi:hypothetical protein